MPRTREQLEQAATDAAEWLDNLDPDDPSVTVEDAADLRAVGLALAAMHRFGQPNRSRKIS